MFNKENKIENEQKNLEQPQKPLLKLVENNSLLEYIME